MRLSLNQKAHPMPASAVASAISTLADLVPGQSGVLTRLDLPEGDAQRLMSSGSCPAA